VGAYPPALVADLIDRFSRDRKVFQSLDYKEEQLRLEFLNPFFESLGWDVAKKHALSGVGAAGPTLSSERAVGQVSGGNSSI